MKNEDNREISIQSLTALLDNNLKEQTRINKQAEAEAEAEAEDKFRKSGQASFSDLVGSDLFDE